MPIGGHAKPLMVGKSRFLQEIPQTNSAGGTLDRGGATVKDIIHGYYDADFSHRASIPITREFRKMPGIG